MVFGILVGFFFDVMQRLFLASFLRYDKNNDVYCVQDTSTYPLSPLFPLIRRKIAQHDPSNYATPKISSSLSLPPTPITPTEHYT